MNLYSDKSMSFITFMTFSLFWSQDFTLELLAKLIAVS